MRRGGIKAGRGGRGRGGGVIGVCALPPSPSSHLQLRQPLLSFHQLLSQHLPLALQLHDGVTGLRQRRGGGGEGE